MRIDRRSFLSLGIGAVAGTALSPIPWKLADDSAIWTQMWPWTPVPPDGEVSFEDSTCTLCPGACGITVRRVNDRAVKIEGHKGHPINNGGVCLLGLSGLQLLYNPARISSPLKRAGKRGEDRWEKITWNQALSMISAKLRELRDSQQSHMVGSLSGSNSGTVFRLLDRFLTAYGSPNVMTVPSVQDSYALTLNLTQGEEALAGFDFENADYILSFGSGLLDGWGSPVRMFGAHSTWESLGAKMIQVESRLSKTAAKANQWIPIVPGTEGALAMGVAYVMIKGGLYDKEFVDQYTFGFEGWTDEQGRTHKGFKQLVLDEYDLASVESITGIKSETIITLGKAFANAAAPIAVCGEGQGVTPGSLHTFLAVHALNALAGNLQRKGGVLAVPTDFIHWPEATMDDIASTGVRKPRLDDAGKKSFPFSRSLPNRFLENILTGKGYPMQVLFITDTNPCYSMPDTSTVKDALEEIPFIVSFSSYRNETALNADLILPNHAYLERWEDVPVTSGVQRPMMGLVKPVVRPLLDTRHTGDVILELARQLGGTVAASFPWDNYESCLKATLQDQWRDLMRNGIFVDNQFEPPPWETAFKTHSKKFEFFVSDIRKVSNEDIDALPHFKPTVVQGDETVYPLKLIAYDTLRLANGYIGDPPFVIKTVSDTVLKGNDVFLEIHPETAKAYGLSDGKNAIVKTPKGKAAVKIRLFNGIMPGVIALPRGLGHTGYDQFLAGKGVNVNALLVSAEDTISGFNTSWGIRAVLEKA